MKVATSAKKQGPLLFEAPKVSMAPRSQEW